MQRQPYILVLAANSREGRKYARLAGLPRGKHRVVFSAKQIRGVKRAEIHELPSFRRRPDRHSILAALRYNRGDWKNVEMPADENTDPRGPLTARQLEVAYRFNALRDAQHAAWDAELQEKFDNLPADQKRLVDELAPPADQGDGLGPQLDIDGDEHPVSNALETKRRRSRCKECGELHFKDEPCTAAPAPSPQPDSRTLFAGPDDDETLPDPSSFFGPRGQ